METPLTHLVQEVVHGVNVVYVGSLLDELYPNNAWFDISWHERNVKIEEWIKAHDAFYYGWSGPSYMCIAERNNGIEAAKKFGKTTVLIEPLS